MFKKKVHLGTSIVFTYSRNVIFFQLMAAGRNGASGVHVQRVVNKESNQEHVNVIRQLLSTVERNVMAKQRKVKCVTRRCPAQVSLNSQSLSEIILKFTNIYKYI